MLEKHVTLSNKMKGQTTKSSLQIEKFSKLVKKIRSIERIKGSNNRFISDEKIRLKNA